MTTLTETAVRRLATAKSFARGEDYYAGGMVLSLARRGDTLEAEVQGGDYEPYQVQATLDDGEILYTDCTCPYDWGGICKHVVATLLAYIDTEDEIVEKPTADSLLAGLDEDQLRDLVLHLVDDRPYLVEEIEDWLGVEMGAEETAVSPPSKSLNPAPYRERAYTILHSLDHMRSSEAYWHVGDVISQLTEIVSEARRHLEAGNGRNALAILHGLTEAYVDDWTLLDGSSGETGMFFADLTLPWAETMLSIDLSDAEREEWAQRLDEWQTDIQQYGIDDDGFNAAHAAAVQGWDHPPLQRILRGETDQGVWDDHRPWFADDLIEARLNVLERQGRYEEALNLAQAEGHDERYVTLLVKLGRIEGAVAYGQNALTTTNQALTLAQVLHEAGEEQAALHIGEHGLDLAEEWGGRGHLAEWLRDAAHEAGEQALALKAAAIACRAAPGLENYEAARRMAGEQWPEKRADLLGHFRQDEGSHIDGKIQIFLQEGLVDDAIKAVERRGYSRLLAEVADAAIESHPDWVIAASKQQAESIMDRGKSKAYDSAAGWLEKARAAYLARGRKAEWNQYLDSLLEKHHRKYSLVPRLKSIR